MRIFYYFLTALLAMNLLQAHAQCNITGSHYTANYNTGWTFTQIGPGTNNPSSSCTDNNQGNIYGSGTAATFFTARGAKEMRLSRDIPVLSNQNWTMDFTVHVSAPAVPGLLENNSPAVILASLSSKQGPIMSGCAGVPGDFCTSCAGSPSTDYRFSDMDAMWVSLTSNAPGACQEPQGNKAWQIVAVARDYQSTMTTNSTPIYIPSGAVGTYYVRLQRTSATTAILSVCSNSNYSTHLAGSPKCFTLPNDVVDLDALNHEVNAEGTCFRVFNGTVDNLKIDNSITCSMQTLTPSFIAPTLVCQGQPITLNASASTGLPVSSHNWGIQECDAAGNVTGSIWWSSAITGQPAASYTIPASTPGVTVSCAKYYKVFLKVANCVTTGTTSKIVQIACNPNFRTNPDVTLCQGESTTLSINYKGTSSYNAVWESISPTQQTLYNGPASAATIVVTPSITTTYQVTVTDNATGCSTTSIVTVYIIANDPSFNLTINTSNANYFTVSMLPNDLTGYNMSGFDYFLAIEELDAANTPYYTYWGGSNCWWGYPGNETYTGFVSTGTGTYTNTVTPSCGSAPGNFLYSHTYRFTRGVLNDYCPFKYTSVLVKPVKSGNGYAMEITEDPNGPDMSEQLIAHHPQVMTDLIHISPNPSTGMFTIELEEGTDAAQIEVTDALGQKVKTFSHKGSRSELDMTGFTKGIYLVTITSNGTSTIKKIILE